MRNLERYSKKPNGIPRPGFTKLNYQIFSFLVDFFIQKVPVKNYDSFNLGESHPRTLYRSHRSQSYQMSNKSQNINFFILNLQTPIMSAPIMFAKSFALICPLQFKTYQFEVNILLLH